MFFSDFKIFRKKFWSRYAVQFGGGLLFFVPNKSDVSSIFFWKITLLKHKKKHFFKSIFFSFFCMKNLFVSENLFFWKQKKHFFENKKKTFFWKQKKNIFLIFFVWKIFLMIFLNKIFRRRLSISSDNTGSWRPGGKSSASGEGLYGWYKRGSFFRTQLNGR